MKDVQVFDKNGKRIDPSDATWILKKETPVLVSADGKAVDPSYLKEAKEGTLILIVHRPDAPAGKSDAPAAAISHDLDADVEKAITALGGIAYHDANAPGKPINKVQFIDPKLTDAGLKELAGLKSLRDLNLSNTRVTDAGMKEVARFKNLRVLYLDKTAVTDLGLKELASLKSLEILYVNGLNVTEAGVAELRKALPKCNIHR